MLLNYAIAFIAGIVFANLGWKKIFAFFKDLFSRKESPNTEDPGV